MRRPLPFTETGIDTPFVVYSVLLVLAIPAGIVILKRLRAATKASAHTPMPPSNQLEAQARPGTL